ncbi:histidine phosphatase family protein [Lactobacillus taiwanensis]|uniref:histidine phosphatase family protein n=1 Tax=Lactobacillus taiwanensis TaxID=508451 RepID=UPI00255829E5|nr:histidine phosphatase family protein [Lactobacillus taiwanensis]
MKLLIIRHGESEADILKVCEGWADFSLTPRGHKQAEAMSKYVSKHYHVDKIYTSSLKRACQTAQYLEKLTGLSAIKTDKLKEFNNGLRAGLPYDEAYKKYPKVELPIHASRYGQESKLNFRMRIESILSEILSQNSDDQTIVIVTHGGAITQLYHALLKLLIDSKIKFGSGDACVHDWNIEGDKYYINFANYCPYHKI